MKRIVVLAGLIAGLAGVSSAQTAQNIIEKYLRAAGGAKALGQVHTATIAGSLTDEATGQTGSYALVTKSPNRF